MKKQILEIVLVVSMLFPAVVFAAKPPDEVQKAKILNKTYRMQIPFIENKGQVEDDSISFYAKTFGGTVFVGKDGTLTYNLPLEDKGGVVIKEILTERKVEVKGLEPSPTRINYFKGNDQSKWKTNIPSYNSVSLGEAYKGVELTLKAHGRNVEKLFKVLPGKDPEIIKVKLEGTKELKINERGELEVVTKLGSVMFTKPVAYQEIDGKRQSIGVAYAIQKGTAYGFKVAAYDRNKPLVIDPLIASTFIGGSATEWGRSLALDGSGNVYVTGYTASNDYPVTLGAYDETHNGGSDVFVSKLDSTLSTLLASIYIGGGNDDQGWSLALDGSGNVYVTGFAWDGYPTTPGAYDVTHNGSSDVFVSKLDSSLTSLLASTLIGGINQDSGSSLALDGSGNVYVTGFARDGYPTTPGAYDGSYNGDRDVFVLKLDDNLNSLVASTFLGGGSFDMASSLALDGSGNVYVTGFAGSDYPTTPGAYNETLLNLSAVFVSKLDGDLSFLLASTFIGDNDDRGNSLALDGSGNVYVTGEAASSDYPTTPGAYDETPNGGFFDVFVSKFDGDLSFLLASTLIGGGDDDAGNSLALDGCGNVYVTGHAMSGYPTTAGAYDETYNGGIADVFVSKLNSDLSSLLTSTFMGGGDWDNGNSLALDGKGNVYVTGFTWDDYPTTPFAYDTSFNSISPLADAIVSKLDSDLSADSGFLSGQSSFLFDPFAVSLKFDVDQDGIFDIPCTELLLCEGQVVDIDVWLDNWDSGTFGAVESVSHDLTAIDFIWDNEVLQVESITCDSQWEATCTVTHTPGTATYHVEVGTDSGGFTGPEIKLITIQLKCIDIASPVTVPFSLENVSVVSSTPPFPIEGSQVSVNAICGAEPLTCTEADHCERLSYSNICPDTGVTEKANDYFWTSQGSSMVCEGDTVNIFHTRTGDYPVTEDAATETICESDCFSECYQNCGYVELQVCYLGCIRGCICTHCAAWDQEEVCYEYQNRINCNVECYSQCYQSYDSVTETAQYNKRCGYDLSEIITISKDTDGDCTTTGTDVESFTLEGAGAAAIGRPMPLDYGTYEVCAGTQLIGQPIEVTDCSTSVCRILLPQNVFTVDRGISSTLENVKVESDVPGDYELSFELRDTSQSQLPVPGALSVPDEVTVTGGGESAPFPVTATNPLPEGGQYDWANVKIKAVEKLSQTVTCEAAFDYYINADEDGDEVPSADDNCPETSNQDQLDTLPPQGNNIGDACDCEADFNCDGNVDGGDVGDFITDFGRSTYFNPCSNQDQCFGDFNCDVNVDGGDVGIFIEDFGRSTYFNPCPACEVGDWCTYP